MIRTRVLPSPSFSIGRQWSLFACFADDKTNVDAGLVKLAPYGAVVMKKNHTLWGYKVC